MHIFVTGATGFIGSAIVQELLHAGHEVTGLARSEEGVKTLLLAGAKVHRGDLDDIAGLQSAAAAADGVIHTAFNHDFSKFKANAETDRLVIEALGSALKGSERPLIVTSAIGVLTPLSRTATESDRPVNNFNPRTASEEAADKVAESGVRISAVRLPPSVHGAGDHGFVPALIEVAREKGISAYVGEGSNCWPAVHRLDAARVFRLALEKNAAPGTRFHAIAEEGIAFRDIAQMIGRRLHVPVMAKSTEEAATHFGWFAHFAGLNCPASGKQTQEQLGWLPDQPGLLADLDSDQYFLEGE